MDTNLSAPSLTKQHPLSPEGKLPWWATLFVLIAVGAFGWWYWQAAVQHGVTNNTDLFANDQKVYMNGATTLRATNYEYMVPRMRMPAYMVALSLAADPDVDHFGFFEDAKKFNVGFSLFCLAVLFLIVRCWLGNWLALILSLIAALQIFILRAAYVQPEIMLTGLVTISIAMLAELLRKPTWWKAIAAGLFCGAWHMTKASTLIAVGGFLAACAVKFLFAGKGNRLPYVIGATVLVVTYLGSISPYLINSYKEFGSPFYNSQSRYFLWAEDVPTKHQLQDLRIDISLKHLTPEQLESLPSPSKYWAANSVKHMQDRLLSGLYMMFSHALAQYTALFYILAVWFGIMLWAIARNFSAVVGAVRRQWATIIFAVVLVAIFSTMYGWFVPLKVGPRLIISMMLVPIFFCMLVTHYCLDGEYEIIAGRRISVEKILALLFLVFWAVLSYLQVLPDLAIGYFGA